MLTFTRTRLAPLGLYLGRHSATVVQLAGSRDRIDLRATAQCRVPATEDCTPEEADERVANALRRLITDHRLSGRKVVGCLSAEELFVETARVPQVPISALAGVVSSEAAERLPYPLDEAELRHMLVGEIKQDNALKQEVILLAARREVVRRRLHVLELAGLTPVGIDVEPCAWLRCLSHAGRLSESMRMAYLFCGETTSTVVFAEGERVLFLKSFPIGGQHFDDAVAQSLGVDVPVAARMRTAVFSEDMLDADNEVHRSVIESLRSSLDALVVELELCLRYYQVTFRGRPPEGFVLSGSEATPWLTEFLCERIGIPARTINPFESVSRMPTSPTIQHRSGRWATAIGLAMKRLAK